MRLSDSNLRLSIASQRRFVWATAARPISYCAQYLCRVDSALYLESAFAFTTVHLHVKSILCYCYHYEMHYLKMQEKLANSWKSLSYFRKYLHKFLHESVRFVAQSWNTFMEHMQLAETWKLSAFTCQCAGL